MRSFQFADRRLAWDDALIVDAMAAAHGAGARPRCMCSESGIPMYVARLGRSFVLKRMPGTGSLHARGCPSLGPPLPSVTLQTYPSAETGGDTVALRLGFSLTLRQMPASEPSFSGDRSPPATGPALTLNGLLNYLWEEADLNRWHPFFAGRRSWATVRKRLLAASAGKTVGGRPLTDVLYVPEVFNPRQRQEIQARRAAKWSFCERSPRGCSRLMLLIGELKDIRQTQAGWRLIIKHVPDRPFLVDGRQALLRDFNFDHVTAHHLAEGGHAVVTATFGTRARGKPWIENFDITETDTRWLPLRGARNAGLPPIIARRAETTLAGPDETLAMWHN